MLNPKVRWNSRSRIRAARLAGTRKQRSEKKFSIDVFQYFYPVSNKTQSCTLVCICSSFIFYAPRLSFGRYCSLCEENEMSKVRCKSKSPLSRLAWSQCRPAAQCSWDLRSTSLLHPEQGARLGIKRLRNNVFRLSSTSTGSLLSF